MDLLYTIVLIIFAKACSLVYLHYKLRKYQKVIESPVARVICAKQRKQLCSDGYYIMQCNLDYGHKGDKHKGIARLYDAENKEFAEVDAWFEMQTNSPMFLNSKERQMLKDVEKKIKEKRAPAMSNSAHLKAIRHITKIPDPVKGLPTPNMQNILDLCRKFKVATCNSSKNITYMIGQEVTDQPAWHKNFIREMEQYRN